MSVLVCVKQHDGCGYIGYGEEWDRIEDTQTIEEEGIGSDMLICPGCDNDHACRVTDENIERLFADDPEGLQRARQLLSKEAQLIVRVGETEFKLI